MAKKQDFGRFRVKPATPGLQKTREICDYSALLVIFVMFVLCVFCKIPNLDTLRFWQNFSILHKWRHPDDYL